MIILNDDQKIRELYRNLSETIHNSYNLISRNNSFKLNKNDVLVSFDSYISSIIFKTIYLIRPLYAGEINFINNLTSYNDHFKNIVIDHDTAPSDELVQEIINECEKTLSEIPAFALMTVMIDKKIEHSNKKESTYSNYIYDLIEEIVEYLKDGEKEELSLKDMCSLFEFYNSNHVMN